MKFKLEPVLNTCLIAERSDPFGVSVDVGRFFWTLLAVYAARGAQGNFLATNLRQVQSQKFAGTFSVCDALIFSHIKLAKGWPKG